MSDLINRQDALDAAKRVLGDYEITRTLQTALRILPSAQPKIIRCKDCKYWLDIDDGRQKHRMCADIYGDWFCADAERRTDE